MYRAALVLLAATAIALAVGLLASPAGAERVDIPVPYHRQVTDWYCAEASLKMVFDYWGEEVPQHDIGDVANERRGGGTYASDLVRAARFSNMSTSIQDREGGGPPLEGYDQRTYGYAAHVHQWKGSGHLEDRYTDMMRLVREGYPVILLCWLDIEHQVTHYRVVKGFDTGTGDFLVHDPALGANLRFNMTLLVDDLWTYYDRWGLVVAPWSVEVTVPPVVGPGETLTVEARVEYPCPPPFDQVERVVTWPEDARAAITVPPPFSLADGENGSQGLNITRGGDEDTVSWRLVSPLEEGFWSAEVRVTVGATVRDTSISYGWYTDRAGGVGTGTVGCDAMPPEVVSFSVAGGEELVADPTVTLAYVTRDAHTNVSQVALSVDGGVTWQILEGASGGTGALLDLGDGRYQLVLRAVDAVGNSATATRSLLLDSTPPRITLFQLAGGEAVTTTPLLQVSVVAEDATTGVDLMALRVGDSRWGAWEPYREELRLELTTDGGFQVDVRVRDGAGNAASASDSVVLDTTAPRVTRFEVARGLSHANASTVPVVFSASDGLDDLLDWSLHEATSGSVGFSPDRTLASGDVRSMEWTFSGEGDQTLVLVVRDHAGHTGEAVVTLVVDTQPPRLTLVLNGGENVSRLSRIPVAVQVTDGTTDVPRARIRVNSNEWGPWSDPGSFRQVDLGPGEGERTVHVQARDMAGNVGEVRGVVHLDTIAPTVSVTFTDTRPGGVVLGNSSLVLEFSEPVVPETLSVLLADNATGVVECEITWTANGTRLVMDPAGSLPRGSHLVLQVTGEDRVGNPLDFRGLVFSTPEAEGDDWSGVIPRDTGPLLLVLLLVVIAVFALATGVARRRA